MKRKRENGDSDHHGRTTKKRKVDSIYISATKATLLNLHILHKFLGPFCISVEENLAFSEEDCSCCRQKLKGEYPSHIWENVQKTGVESYIIDALVRDLFHRGGGKEITTNADSTKVQFHFTGIQHIPWFASHIILYRCQSLEVNLNFRQSLLDLTCIMESDKIAKEEMEQMIMREWTGSILQSMQKALLKKSLDDFCKS